jgi:hypothetical protein
MKKILFLTIMTALVWLSCDKKNYNLDETFTIQVGQSATVASIKISLDSVSDSRCPTGAVCVTNGAAIGHFTFTKGDEKLNRPLRVIGLSSPPPPDTVTVFGKKAILFDILPYPDVNTNIAQKDYKAKLKIE